ncbi:helix-turn-helix domain-containing protein [Streptomyces sp. NBC_01233]|uniref:helix-turn-helix domain-containing protein n=1 Tax=Streptomyces sp. NBC_01233 TaxID=2903787 RepID=UPI002E161E9D|nr:helix-turn-helix domain-containing protein [Streptomyces sp. NBC_01233]
MTTTLERVSLVRLALELTRARKAAGFSQDDAISKTAVSSATLYRIENWEGRPQLRTLIALLDFYRVKPALRAHIMKLWEQAKPQRGKRSDQAQLRPEYTLYMELEREARSVLNWEAAFVPGLCQTEPYARAVIGGVLPNASPDVIERRVRARMGRQELLTKPSPLHVTAIMDEAALRRHVGGPHLMAEQLRHLQELAKQPQISLRVIPFAAGAHPGMACGSYAMLTFPGADHPEIVYPDSMAKHRLQEQQAQLGDYTSTFDTLGRRALSPDDSLGLISTVMAQLTQEQEKAA